MAFSAVLAFNNSEAPQAAFRGTVFVPPGTQFESNDVANTTFAAHSILVGMDFSDPFGDASEFTLFIRGRRNGIVTGSLVIFGLGGLTVLLRRRKS